MSKGVNRVIILGSVGKDPEVRYMPSGDAIASFSVATSEQWTDKNGEKQERTEWHNITAFKKVAEIIAQYVSKGDKIYIEGKLKTEKYQKQGVDHYATKIIVDQVQLLGSKSDGQKQEKPVVKQSAEPDFEDDIPF